jgi:hypothetical protein
MRLRRRDVSTAEEIAKLLIAANARRHPGRRGMLMTAPLVVLCGKHRGDFGLFDQDGAPSA